SRRGAAGRWRCAIPRHTAPPSIAGGALGTTPLRLRPPLRPRPGAPAPDRVPGPGPGDPPRLGPGRRSGLRGAVVGLGDGDQIFGKRFPPGKYVLDGFFQRVAWYYDRGADLGRIFRPAPLAGKNWDDIVVNVRLG